MDDEIYYSDTFDNLEKMDTFMKKITQELENVQSPTKWLIIHNIPKGKFQDYSGNCS